MSCIFDIEGAVVSMIFYMPASGYLVGQPPRGRFETGHGRDPGRNYRNGDESALGPERQDQAVDRELRRVVAAVDQPELHALALEQVIDAE